ncbi:nucleotidyltransferase domain-containing protein [Pontibacter sp. BT310]|uniref:Nucleotidyltransferase domain-containing protein n=1 Tax=Pontibacter populi TaxID=890055 RepID=A0ABS6XAC8_9BACT|nr:MULTISPECIES: nucleotidyltransferase domain-containing protein [Pontibacter]MBJ6118096.1 nucleotidyltransferase domain-containing protein [Pontibacter sp. BT310]MBR0570523.1 nucleotidyltransferase domain-containing protein [Microvirga sp. STS03]MBW3364949.1 nucleotidyltransferase domain-containing protein [Pontibacter populi]
MQEQILQKLREIEAQYKVQILLASETGSRAWGFPSPDSDYDVRFIYRHTRDWYLSIDEQRDTIEYLSGDLDLVGWDIRKCLRLLRKSNIAMFERLSSPIVYLEQTDLRKQLQKLASNYFSCRAGLHHYASMAGNYYKACEAADMVKLKSYFYLLRTTLCSLWIVEKQSIPPLAFQKLLPLVENQTLRTKIEELLILKAQVDETYLHPKELELEQYLKRMLDYCDTRAIEFEKHQGETAPLNQLFSETIAKPWH